MISEITDFEWSIPSYSDLYSGFDFMDIATVNSSGLVTVKKDAMQGLATFLFASVKNSATAFGVGTIIVGSEIVIAFPF